MFEEIEITPSLKLKKRLEQKQLKLVCRTIRDRISPLISETPTVSIVVSAHNEEMYMLSMLLAMSRLQTKYRIEFIGVDNGSTDRTAQIFSESGFRYLSESRKGISYARQAGLQAAKGDYIFTTDADTLVPSTWVDASLKYFLDNESLVCFSGGVNSKTLGTSKIYDIFRGYLRKWNMKRSKRNKFNFPGANSVFLRKIALKIGGYKAGRDIGEDCLLARNMSQYGDILNIDNNLDVLVTTSGRRTSNLFRVAKMLRERALFILSPDDTLREGKTFSDVR